MRQLSQRYTREVVRGIVLDKFYVDRKPCRRKFTALGCEKYYPNGNDNLVYVQKSFLHDGLSPREGRSFTDRDGRPLSLFYDDPQRISETFIMNERLHILLENDFDSDTNLFFPLRHSIVASFEEIWGKSIRYFADLQNVPVSTIES